jgi:cytochrome c-type biogenesis protein
MNFTDLAVSGPLLLAALLAATAGAVSFASPCCLPLVPGYLAYLAGLVGADAPTVDGTAQRTSDQWRVTGAALLFVLGFTVVFAAGTMTVLGVSGALRANEQLLQRIGGAVTIVMGLVFLGWFRPLQRSVKLPHQPRDGLWGAPLLGATYGLGWTPCLGPTLAGVIALASGTQVGGTTWRGLLLIVAYCLGLGGPFIALALGARWAVGATGWVRRHARRVQQLGGLLLLMVGTALVSGLWGDLIGWLRGSIAGLTSPI